MTKQHLQCICTLAILASCYVLLSTAGKKEHHAGQPDAAQQRNSNLRSLKQSPVALLQLIDADDPFAGARDALLPGAGLVSSLVQPALGFVQQRNWQMPWLRNIAGARTSTALPRVPTGNATHTYRFSHTMQITIPQPWDNLNMSHVLRDNLEQDLLFWQQVEYIPSVYDVIDQARNHPEIARVPNTRRLVEIRNNQLRFPLMPPEKQTTCDEWCDPQLYDFVLAMKAAVDVYKLDLPDVLFIINVDDSPVCNQEQVLKRECKAPVVSLSKETHMADLIGPVLKKSDAEVVHRYAPWISKRNMAFFRGVPSCGDMPFPPRCARTLAARLAQMNYSDILDVGLVEEYNSPAQIEGDPVLRDGNGSLPVLSRVSMAELPKYKWLLNLDGHTAAYRLANLLAVNSLVLKQHTNMVEYYYRSLRPFHHYVPIFKTSEHDLIPRIEWAMTHEELVKRIISNANHFALTYTTYRARVLYWKYVLLAYKKLIPDMEDYFRATGQQGYASLSDITQERGKTNASLSYLETALKQLAHLPAVGDGG